MNNELVKADMRRKEMRRLKGVEQRAMVLRAVVLDMAKHAKAVEDTDGAALLFEIVNDFDLTQKGAVVA